MFYSVDRFEEDQAVLCDDDENTRVVPRAALPQGTTEGDVLIETAEGFVPDATETEARRARVRALQERLRRRS